MFRMGKGDLHMRGGQWVSLGVELIDQDQESGRSDIRLAVQWQSSKSVCVAGGMLPRCSAV